MTREKNKVKNERRKKGNRCSDVDTDIVRENYPEIISETVRLARVKGETLCETRTGGEGGETRATMRWQ